MSFGRTVKDESGETIVETLVSILIGTIALLMLATAISTSARIVTSSKDAMDEHYASESAMVGTSASPVATDATVALVPDAGGTEVETFGNIKVYADDLDAELPIARYTTSTSGGGA